MPIAIVSPLQITVWSFLLTDIMLMTSQMKLPNAFIEISDLEFMIE